MLKCKEFLNELIVTGLFIGKIQYAPGTFGSLLALPLSYIILQLAIMSTGVLIDFFSVALTAVFYIFFGLIAFAIIVPFIIGVKSSNNYIKRTGKQDPKEIVIDEVVGQMLTIFLCLPSITFLEDLGTLLYHMDEPAIYIKVLICCLIMPFTLFRLFDIKKPWPINWIDKNIPGGLGVMLDDIIAALFASVMHYALIFLWIDFIK